MPRVAKVYKRKLSKKAIEAMRRGGEKRAAAMTSEELSQWGRLGYLATVEKHGWNYWAERFIKKARENPTILEKPVLTWLVDNRVPHVFQELVGRYIVDFLVGKIVLEVNGQIWHSENNPFRPDALERDAKKYQALKDLGYTVIIIPEQAIKSGEYTELLERLFCDRF